jgi:filamentous hemagglutinin family protein
MVYRQSRLICALGKAGLGMAAAVVLHGAGLAQIRTDSSLGQSAQTLAGPAYVIPQSLGRLAGSNLFHSFQSFNINTGESANFTTTTAGLGNVISRVTGGTMSQINGLIALTAIGAAPNFYFINPAGVTFGAGASVDVPGAFHVSTANYLKFPDGRLYADTSSASTFSSADPVAFGFLGDSRASILVKDSVLHNAAGDITLVAGDLAVDNAALWTGSGDIRVSAIGSDPTEASLRDALPLADGRLEMNNGSFLYSGALAQSAGGNIMIAAGNASLQGGAQVMTDSTSARPAGSITAELGSLVIDGRSATSSTGITSLAAKYDVGAGGNVAVTARGAMQILGGGMVNSETYGLGAAGNVAVKAGSLLLDGIGHANAARISSRSGLGAIGNAGSVAVDVADSIVLSNASRIISDSQDAGQAGNIILRAGNDIRILSGSVVASDTYAAGNAGNIDLSARNLTVDGTGSKLLTRVSSQAFAGSLGNAGSIHVSTSDALNLINGGKIISDTDSVGKAGDISVATGTLLLDGRDSTLSTGIFSSASFDSSGNGGMVDVRVAGDAQILQSARVGSDTWSKGRGGDIFLSANNLLIDSLGSPYGAAISSGANESSSGDGGSVAVDVAGHLQLINSGQISATTWASGNAGAVSVTAGMLTINDKGKGGTAGIDSSSLSIGGNTKLGNTGQVSVTVSGDALLAYGGVIQSSTQANFASETDQNSRSVAGSSSRAGDIKIVIGGELRVEEKAVINSTTFGTSNSGNIEIQVGGNMIVGVDGLITSATLGTGNGGSVGIKVAGNMNIGADGLVTSGTYGIGNGGSIGIKVAGNMNIDVDGFIDSSTTGVGNSGNIGIHVSGNLNVGSGAWIASHTLGSGAAGNLDISASQLAMAGGRVGVGVGHDAWILSDSLGSGAAGRIDVTASKSIELAENSWITSDARGSGHAGTVSVNAPDIRIGGTGMVRGAAISSSAFSTGDAGRVEVNAQTVTVMGGNTVYPTGIEGRSGKVASGNAGTVVVNTSGALRVLGGGAIASSTELSGRGGEVQVKAGSIEVSGEGSQIGAAAKATSTGQPGNVSVRTDGALVLASGGSLSIQNDGNSTQPSSVSPSLLSVQAAQLSLVDGGSIKANATGNVAAGSLQIKVGDHLSLDGSSINTSANSGNGGPISISVGELLTLSRSQITTSVLGTAGSGGDIHVGTNALVMNSGFIQANTAASNASGGLVGIDVQTLVASGNTLFVGGQVPYEFAPGVFGFNVVQAAAPTGVSGTIAITSPVLDVSGSLRGLDAQVLDSGGLGRNPCQTTGGSSLVQIGRGGLPASSRGLLGADMVMPVADVAPQWPLPGPPKTTAPAWLRTGGCR